METIALALFRIKFIEDAVLKLLNFLAGILGNYGLAIIATTIIIKILLYPLSVKQEKSMYKMKLLQPKLDEINKKYKGDKAMLSQKTAELYKESGTNPLGGCLPLLIQLPILIALYYTFSSSAIPKYETFLWFNLTEPDKLFTIAGFNFNLLPILSGILMFIQQKATMPESKNSGNAENSMQKAMMFMPVMMTFLFYNFPAGVNLYYVLNSALSILQQRYIQAKVKKEYESN